MINNTGNLGMKHLINILGLVCACGLGLMAGTASAAGALHVEESTTVDAPPAAVWQTIGKFSNLAWHPVVAETRLVAGQDNQKDAVRKITTRDGAVIMEKLQALDAGARRMRYEILESPLPVAHYVSTLSVQAVGKRSRIVWKSDFDAVHSDGVDDAKAREIVSGIYKAGFDGLRKQLEGK